MGVLDRIGILVKAKIKARMDAEDPEKILDRSINDMQAILAGYHQNCLHVIN
jgi:phage shock protein A